MLSLLLRKNTLLALVVLGVFSYPMLQSGELSLSSISGWMADEPQPDYDPYYQASSSATFRPASIGNSSTNPLPGTQGNYQIPPTAQPSSAANGDSIGGQIGDFLGSLFETQPADASGQAIPQIPTNTGAPTQPVPGTTATGLETAPIYDIREIVRFDATPQWVQQRWPRVSAAPVSEEGYQGLRVPLTAAPGTLQLTGALTYYFDAAQTVQRIQFMGTTNQPMMLEQFCGQYFQFQKFQDLPGVMAPVHEEQPRGLLKFSLPVVLDRNQPQLTQVIMEINSTKGAYQLSQLMKRLAIQ